MHLFAHHFWAAPISFLYFNFHLFEISKWLLNNPFLRLLESKMMMHIGTVMFWPSENGSPLILISQIHKGIYFLKESLILIRCLISLALSWIKLKCWRSIEDKLCETPLTKEDFPFSHATIYANVAALIHRSVLWAAISQIATLWISAKNAPVNPHVSMCQRAAWAVGLVSLSVVIIARLL